MINIKLVEPSLLEFASYNPRKVYQERLDLVRLSIRKLGWLLPVYATESGEILSGHQRVLTATQLGHERVPVVFLPSMDDRKRKAVNILFNRSTNDFDRSDVSQDVTKRLLESDVMALAGELDDCPMDYYPCMNTKTESIAPYVKANSGKWVSYARNVARSLNRLDVLMPIIVDGNRQVVNGIGRLQMLAEKKINNGHFLELDEKRSKLAALMLNLLSMDFDIHTKYEDLLRYNSFRRARRTRAGLGRGFVFAIIGNKTAKTFDINNPTHRARWIRKFGKSIVDFGAGHLQEAEMLRRNGVYVSAFEPYRLGSNDDIDKPLSIATTKAFLADVRSGKQFSSVFISSVLNSVPFRKDREHIVKICSALCSKNTTVYAVASGTGQTGYTIIGRDYLADTQSGRITTPLDYEPGIVLGDISDLPKVQKFHDASEFYDLFKTAFESVQAGTDAGVNVYAIAQKPLPYDGLKDALEFEFNLPYPDNSRMDMVYEAVEAFSTRLGIKI